jgi:hypothetical protein
VRIERVVWGQRVIHEVTCLFSIRYLVITGPASKAGKLRAHNTERLVHAGFCIQTSENVTFETV